MKFKAYIIIIALSLLTPFSYAQVDRSKAPSPAPAREIKIGAYQTFSLKNGLQVFVVENHKLPRVQFSLQLRNNPILEGKKAGYVALAGDLIGTGTKTRTKAQLDEEVDFIGASLNTSSSGIFASSLTKHTDKLVELMTDVLYNASMSPEELEKLRKLTLSALAADKDDPDAITSNVRGVLVYGKGHTYGEISTEETVAAVTIDDCVNYYKTYFKPNNAYLAIVGDINMKSAKSIVEKYFGKWASGEVVNPTYPMPKQPAGTYVALVDRPVSVQSVINVTYPLDLKPGHPDVIKAAVMNQILGGSFSSRLFQNLREDKGFTYGARSTLSPDILAGSFNAYASVRNEVTDSSVYEFIYELKRIVNEPVTDTELAASRAALSGAFGRSLENPQTVANFALNTARYNLPKDYYNNYVKNINAVTKEDVQAAAKSYIKPDNAYILVVGKGSEVADKLSRFGEVKYYDNYGEPYTPTKVSPLPAGLTAEKVIDSYIQAIGGKEKIAAIKSYKLTGKTSMQGAEIAINETWKAPNKRMVEVLVNGSMQVQKIVCSGTAVSMKSMGQATPVDEATKEETLFESHVVPELVLNETGVKLILKGIEKVDNGEAYVVEYGFPSGGKTLVYFDTKTGLKVRSSKEQDTPQGKINQITNYLDYKEYAGVKMVSTFSQTMGPTVLKVEIVSMETNIAVDDSLFVTE